MSNVPSPNHSVASRTLPSISGSPSTRIRSGSSTPVSWIISCQNSSGMTKFRVVGSGYGMLAADFDRRIFLSKLDFLGSLAMTASSTLRSPVPKMSLVAPATVCLALTSIRDCNFLANAPARSLGWQCSVGGWMMRSPL